MSFGFSLWCLTAFSKLTWECSILGWNGARARAARIVKSVLFVCTGNICRSPIAEGLFRRLLGNRRDIAVASAGVHAVRGQPPSLYAVQVCEEEGVDISGFRSQPLTAALIDWPRRLRSLCSHDQKRFTQRACVRRTRRTGAHFAWRSSFFLLHERCSESD